MKPETAGEVKFGVSGSYRWGSHRNDYRLCVGGATGSTTQKISKEAVLASQVAICVAEFMKEPNHKEKLKELKALDSWNRAGLIEKGGWDKMPGQEKSDYLLFRACADGLELLFGKSK
jgi:hypothetical protein